MSTSPVTVQLTEEQKILSTITFAGKAASDIAGIWGHGTISALTAEVPMLAPAMIGFLDAILAAIAAQKKS